MDAAIAAALHRKANPPGNRDFTDNLLKALNEVAEQGTPSSWAPKPKNPMLPESDVESIAGLPPGDTPRSAWLGGGGRFDSIRTLPGEDEEEGSEAEAAQIEEPSRRAGSGGGEVAAGPSGTQQYSRDAASDAGSDEHARGGRPGYLEAITTTILPSVVGFGLALLVSGATMPLIRPRKQREAVRQYRSGASHDHREDEAVYFPDGAGADAYGDHDHADAADFEPAADGGAGEMHADA